MGGFAAAVAARKFIFTNAKYSAIEGATGKDTPILPPGARNIEAFKDACTACHACVAACPNKIIKPASFEYGIDGIMLPTVKYDKKYCSYECNACAQTCPHGALKHLSFEEKQKTQIALAVYDPSTCIVVAEGLACGACSRNCPAGAIKMIPDTTKPELLVPQINPALCIGCGACEYACPAAPRAISIYGKTVQTQIS